MELQASSCRMFGRNGLGMVWGMALGLWLGGWGVAQAGADPVVGDAAVVDPPTIEELFALATAGNSEAQLTLGSMYEDREAFLDAYRWFHRAAEAGAPGGQFKVGLFILTGKGGSAKAGDGVAWLRKAADQGFAAAQFNLAVCYEKGIGVDRDVTEALRFYRLSAAQGNAPACQALGVFHEKGVGLEADPVEAWKWYAVAHRLGSSQAGLMRDRLTRSLSPLQVGEARQRESAYSAARAIPMAKTVAVEKPATPVKKKDFLE